MKRIIHLFVLTALVLMGGQTFAQNKHQYVDLGLPSGTLWATCNVGATTPEGYGSHFAWGEITTKTFYRWDTYRYSRGDYKELTKYCNKSDCGANGFTDRLTVLQASDDAATANWGSGWCMPTKAQWEELYQNTTTKWTTRNGVKGRLFTAKNGNSLFLPAAGYRWGEKGNEHGGAGVDGYYWSSSLSTNYPDSAWSFYFGLDSYADDGMHGYVSRSGGMTVRPVRSARQN